MLLLFFMTPFLDNDPAAGGGAAVAEPERPASGREALASLMSDLRSRVSDDGSTIRGDAPADPAPDGGEGEEFVDETGQKFVRTTDGKFAPSGAVTGDDPPADPNADPNADPAADPNAEPDPSRDDLRVELPRGEDDQPRVIFADSPETAAELRELTERAMTREELTAYRARVDRDADHLDVVQDMIRTDPVDFVLQHIDSADTRRELLISLLAQEGMLAEVGPLIELWGENDRERQLALREQEAGRASRRRDVEAKLSVRAETREITRSLTDAANTLALLVPAEQRSLFVDDLFGEMQNFYRQNPKVGRLTQDQMVQVWSRRLGLYGVEKQAATSTLTTGRAPTRRASPKGDAAKKLAADATAARQTGTRFRQQATVRRTVSVTPTPGSGVTPAPTAAMPKEDMKSRISRLRGMFRR